MSSRARLTRVTTSPPFVCYVPVPKLPPDSDTEEWLSLELDHVIEDSPFRTPTSDANPGGNTLMHRDLEGNDITERGHVDPEPPNPNPPDLRDQPDHPRDATPLNHRLHEANSTRTGSQEYIDLISFKDWNVRVLIGNNSFKLHEHQLSKFSALEKLIRAANENRYEPDPGHGTCTRLELPLNDESPTDFENMVEILYLNVCDGVTDDDHSIPVLKSTLRLATKYEYEHMREYAILCLEKRDLTPIERIELARECNIPLWSREALNELCARDELITLAEASILGLDTFFELAHRREAFKMEHKPSHRPSSNRSRGRQNVRTGRTPSPSSPRRSPRINLGKNRAQPY
ncbi:BTB/POZ domain, partial [Rhizoctonia solani]